MSTGNVALTSSMRSNLLSLQNTQALFDSTQEKLSTGYAVNSAMDNPSSYFTAQSLNSRADDLNTLLDSIGQAVSTLEVADEGITSLQDLVSQAKSIANSARDTSNVQAETTSTVYFDPDKLKSEKVTEAVQEVDSGDTMTIRYGDSTSLTGTKNVQEDTKLSSINASAADFGSVTIDGTKYKINTAGTENKMTAKVEYDTDDGVKFLSDTSKEDGTSKYMAGDDNNLTETAYDSDGDGTDDKYFYTYTRDGHTWTLDSSTDFDIDADIAVTTSDDGTMSLADNGGTAYTETEVATLEASTSDEAETVFKATKVTGVGANAKITQIEDGNGNKIDIADGIKVANVSEGGFIKGLVVEKTVSEDGKTTYTVDESGAEKIAGNSSSKANAVDGDATITIKQSSTVGEMAEVMESMIGNTKVDIGVDDSKFYIKTKDTTSVEVADSATTGVGIATTFGLDTGKTIKLAADDTAESLRQKIESAFADDSKYGGGVLAEFDDKGALIIKSEYGDDLVISGDLAEGLGVDGQVTNGNNERAQYASQFNDLLVQIDELVQDTSYKGINLLAGDDLTVVFNESSTSKMELKGVTFDSTGLGFTEVDNEWKTTDSIDTSLDQITKATSVLRTQASQFGQQLSTIQIRQDFTENMINELQTGADKLVLADTNEEATKLLALQTQQSLGIKSLSMANESSQSVLQLF